MFFYVDESGNTGTNLFDENQPFLYYGVLSTELDLDVEADLEVKRARERRGVERLHASELGMKGLADISQHLLSIQCKYQTSIDICRIVKADHAVICFFDQVFDQGMNPAASWFGYWSPLRYLLLLKLAALFDSDLAKSAWKARIDINNKTAEDELVEVCSALIPRLSRLPDPRSRQLIGDTLRWAIDNPEKLEYNCKSAKDVLTVAPNIIGFQSVMHNIASRLKGPDASASITVDQQLQFNKAQRNLAAFYANMRNLPATIGLGLPEMDLTNIPTAPILFKSSRDSIGLELVDNYLWILKRALEGKELAEQLKPIVELQSCSGRSYDISLSSINDQWSPYFENLPLPTEKQFQDTKEILQKHEERRLRAIKPI